MGQDNSELISNITRQFARQVTPGFLRKLHFTSGYFNMVRTLGVENTAITTQDPAVLNRIFDSVAVDAGTRAQFYDAVMRAKDPIREILIPLIDAIAEKIMVSDRSNLNEEISADFKKYAEIRKLFSDETFHDVMLRAIASACLANLADFTTEKTKPLMETGLESHQLEARTINQAFMRKISGPFDGYLSSLTAQKFKEDLARSLPIRPPQFQDGAQPDHHWFLAMVLRALQNLVNLFSGQGNKDQHAVSSEYDVNIEMVAKSSEIEPRVRGLSIVADRVVATMTSYRAEPELLKHVQRFADDLFGLITEINDSREMDIDFETKVTTGFEKICEGFSARLSPHIQDQADGPEERAEVLRIVNELTEQLRPSRSTTPDTGLGDSCDDETSYRM